MIAEATYLPAMVYGPGVRMASGALSPYANRGVAATPTADAAEDATLGARRRPASPVTIDITGSRQHTRANHQVIVSGAEPVHKATVSAAPMVTYSDKATLIASDQTPRGLLINITV